tara:strand:+ start:105 stop:416 length:312 start_codon:yes stop_codon:yes gene_type:complete
MFDEREDQKLAVLWESGVETGKLDDESMAELAQNGMKYCEGYCPSKKYTGEDRCRCVREIFPSPKEYKRYQEARSLFKRLLQFGLLAKASSKDINGDNNDNLR